MNEKVNKLQDEHHTYITEYIIFLLIRFQSDSADATKWKNGRIHLSEIWEIKTTEAITSGIIADIILA